MPPLAQRDIREILPHRYPFLMVDAVLEHDHDTILALKNVTATDPFLAGHFPDDPVFPGVLLIEACGQAGGIMLALSGRYQTRGYLAQVSDFKFLSFAVPGDQLELRARFEGAVGSFARVSVEVEAGGRKVARGTISYFFGNGDAR